MIAETDAMKIPFAALALSIAGLAQAAPVTCQTSQAAITGVSMFNADGTLTALPVLQPIESAACSSFRGSANFDPKTNLGYAGDGVLNGSNPHAFQGGAFITASQLQDLRGDGSANDPGWIMLGQYNMGNGNGGTFVPSAIGSEKTANIVQTDFFSATEEHAKGKDAGKGLGDGTWSFTPDALVTQRAAAVFGANWFDQMALVFKFGNDYVAYDFTTAQFGQTLTSSSPVLQWSGTYDVRTFQTGSDFSQITLWIRDPAALANSSAVPEPASMALVGLGILGICVSRYRRKA